MNPRSMSSSTGKGPDIASASVPDTLLALRVNPETGLTRAEVDTRRKEHGYNEAPGRQVISHQPGMQGLILFECDRDKQGVLFPFDQEKQTLLAFCLRDFLN
jgi:hypothetical protein